MANLKQAALVKARERRVALDRDRAARDGRVEQAAARVFVLLEQRVAAQVAMLAADAGIGQALRELVEEGIPTEGVAQLCELEVAEVRRLVRTSPPASPLDSGGSATVTALGPASPAEADEQPGDWSGCRTSRRRNCLPPCPELATDSNIAEPTPHQIAKTRR